MLPSDSKILTPRRNLRILGICFHMTFDKPVACVSAFSFAQNSPARTGTRRDCLIESHSHCCLRLSAKPDAKTASEESPFFDQVRFAVSSVFLFRTASQKPNSSQLISRLIPQYPR